MPVLVESPLVKRHRKAKIFWFDGISQINDIRCVDNNIRNACFRHEILSSSNIHLFNFLTTGILWSPRINHKGSCLVACCFLCRSQQHFFPLMETCDPINIDCLPPKNKSCLLCEKTFIHASFCLPFSLTLSTILSQSK